MVTKHQTEDKLPERQVKKWEHQTVLSDVRSWNKQQIPRNGRWRGLDGLLRIFFLSCKIMWPWSRLPEECVHTHFPVGQYFPSIRVFQDLAWESQGCPHPVPGDSPAPNRGWLQASRHPFLPTLTRCQRVGTLPNSNPQEKCFSKIRCTIKNCPVIIFQEPTEAFKKAEWKLTKSSVRRTKQTSPEVPVDLGGDKQNSYIKSNIWKKK